MSELGRQLDRRATIDGMPRALKRQWVTLRIREINDLLDDVEHDTPEGRYTKLRELAADREAFAKHNMEADFDRLHDGDRFE